MALVQLSYYSKPVLPQATALIPMVKDILSVAVPTNGSLDLTGYLMFDKDWFVQVLEGEDAAVMALYSKLLRDKRHRDVALKHKRKIVTREFGGWSMGAVLKSVETSEVLLTHGIGASLDPIKMSHDQIVMVARDLSRRQRSANAPTRQVA